MFKDSAKFWFPRLVEVGKHFQHSGSPIFIPNTVFVDYNEAVLFGHNQNDSYSELQRLDNALDGALRYEITTQFAFMRTDVTSAKHLGINAIRVDRVNNFSMALHKLLKHAETKTALGKNKSSAIMLRDWIETAPKATAFGGLPVVREWRVFSDGKEAICVNGYWPDEALHNHMDNGAVIPHDVTKSWYVNVIADAAIMAANEMGGGIWSVDFMEDKFGQIWLIDMATGENSYHHEDCKNCGLDKFLDL